MKYYIYLLTYNNKIFYCGRTISPERRLLEHKRAIGAANKGKLKGLVRPKSICSKCGKLVADNSMRRHKEGKTCYEPNL